MVSRIPLVLASLGLFAALTGCTAQPGAFGAALTSPTVVSPMAALPASTPASTPAVGAPIVPGAGPGPLTLPGSNHVTGTYPSSCHSPDGRHPDPGCTPGAVRSDVTQANIATTICRKGWTATVRPATSETDRLKRAAMRAYGEPAATIRTTELDHEVPLELAGSNAAANLWPEPSDEPGHGFENSKDQVEDALNHAVCSHRVPLAAAQQAIDADWTTAEAKLGVTR